jgi:hypothetical protein
MKNVMNLGILAMMLPLMETPTDKNSSGEKAPETKEAEAGSPEKDEFFGSTLQKAAVEKAVTDGNIKLVPQSKTQKTRGKGSRELTYNWNDVEFVNTDGVLAFVGGDEDRLLKLLSNVASDMNQQAAWETLFEVTDEDKLIRQAAKRIAQVLGISEDAAEIQVREMVVAKAKEAAQANG